MLEYPSFQSYPNDWKNDAITSDWDIEMIGAYRELIDAIWLNNGEYPLVFSKLSIIFRQKTKKTTEKMWNKIKIKFFIVENDGPQIHHKRVDEERQRLEANRLRSSNGGKKGMAKRWNKDKGLIKNDKYTVPISDTVTSTPTKKKTKRFTPPTHEQVSKYAKSIGFDLNVDKYMAKYQCNGWKVGANGMKDWKASVRYWKTNNYGDIKGNNNVQNTIPLKFSDQVSPSSIRIEM